MPILEQNILIRHKNKDGNIAIQYPITKSDNIVDLDEFIDEYMASAGEQNIITFATEAEAIAGAVTDKAVSPATLHKAMDAHSEASGGPSSKIVRIDQNRLQLYVDGGWITILKLYPGMRWQYIDNLGATWREWEEKGYAWDTFENTIEKE